MSLAVALRGTPFEITVFAAARSRSGLPRADIRGEPAAVVMDILDPVDVVELRDMLARHANSRFLFLAGRLPLRAAAARIIRQRDAVVLAKSEPSIVVVATLVAMLSGDEP